MKEGRNLSTELNSVTADKQKLQNENTRLNHRIEYLEDQVAELENIWNIRNIWNIWTRWPSWRTA